MKRTLLWAGVIVFVLTILVASRVRFGAGGYCPDCGGGTFIIQPHTQYGEKLDCMRCGKILSPQELVPNSPVEGK